MKKLALLMCLILVFSMAVFAGCGGSDKETGETGQTTTDNGTSEDRDDSPAADSDDAAAAEQVAVAFWTAAMSGDVDGSWNMFSEERQSSLTKEAWSKGVSNLAGVNVKADPAVVKGDTATVLVRVFNLDVEASSSKVSLVKENGAWKVDMP